MPVSPHACQRPRVASCSVEVTAEGARMDLDELLSALRNGPHLGTVNDIQYHFGPATDEFKQFWYLETY